MAVVSVENPKKKIQNTQQFQLILIIKSAIDAHGRRDVANIDIPGAFLHGDSYKHIIMVLKGKLSLLMCHMDKK